MFYEEGSPNPFRDTHDAFWWVTEVTIAAMVIQLIGQSTEN